MTANNVSKYAILFSVENELERWITAEIRKRGWSIRELARRGGVSHTAVNNALSGSARLDTYKGIATGLGVSLIEVLRHAGEIPPQLQPVPEEAAALGLIRRLSPESRQAALAMLRGLVTADEREERGEGERERGRVRMPATATGRDWFPRALAALPADAGDAELRPLIVAEINRIFDEDTIDDIEFLARLFVEYAARKRRQQHIPDKVTTSREDSR